MLMQKYSKNRWKKSFGNNKKSVNEKCGYKQIRVTFI